MHERVLTFRVALPRAVRPSPESRRAFLNDLERGLRGLAGVDLCRFHVAAASDRQRGAAAVCI